MSRAARNVELGSTPTEHLGGRTVLILVALWVIGVVLRFHGLGDRDFWFDESCTFVYVHNLFDWPRDSRLLVESTNLPYYVALRGWTTLFGESEAGYRALSALAAVLTIPLLGMIGLRLGGPLAAIASMAIVALHPLHIYYAHEARAYALWLLLLSFALLLLCEACRSGRRSWWITYSAVVLLTLHLHYFTIYWIPASLAGAWLFRGRVGTLRRWLFASMAVVAAFVPYFWYAVLPAAQGGGSAWIADIFDPVSALPRSLWGFLPAGAYPAHLRGLSTESPDTIALGSAWLTAATQIMPVILLVLVVLILARAAWRQPPRNDRDPSITMLVPLAALTLIPLGCAWLYSVAIRPIYLVGRYDLVAWPAMMVWLGVAVAAFARIVAPQHEKRAFAIILAALLACSVLPIARLSALHPPPTFHHLRADRLASLVGPRDLVIAFSYDRDHLQYYLHRAGFQGRLASYPSWLQRQVGWVDIEADRTASRGAALLEDAARLGQLVDRTFDSGGAIWLLADSLERHGLNPRDAVNQVLLSTLHRTDYVLSSEDSELLIWKLRRPSSASGLP